MSQALRKFWKSLRRSSSLHIFVGLALGQGVVLLSTPVLTRLYSPQEIGVSGTFLAAASIAGTLATFRFEALIPAAQSAVVVWLIGRALATTAVVTFLATLTYWYVSGGDVVNAALFGATVAGLAAVGLLMQVASRRQSLRGIPTAKAVQGAGQTGMQVGSGLAAATGVGMQVGIAAGYLLSAATQLFFLRRHQPETPYENDERRPRKRRLVRQAFVLVVAALINMCTVWMYPLLTQLLFGSEVTGHLTIAQRIGLVPAAMIVASLTPVIISRMSELIRNGEPVKDELRRWLYRLFPFGIVALIVMLTVPESWIATIFGGEWSLSREFLSAMGLMVAAQVVIGPFGMLLVLQGRSRTQLIWDATRLLALLLATSVTAVWTENPVAMIWSASIVLTGFYAIYAVLVLKCDQGTTS